MNILRWIWLVVGFFGVGVAMMSPMIMAGGPDRLKYIAMWLVIAFPVVCGVVFFAFPYLDHKKGKILLLLLPLLVMGGVVLLLTLADKGMGKSGTKDHDGTPTYEKR